MRARTSPEALSSFPRTWRKVRRYLAATPFSGRRRRLRHPRYVPWKEENSGNPGEERRFRWEGDGGRNSRGWRRKGGPPGWEAFHFLGDFRQTRRFRHIGADADATVDVESVRVPALPGSGSGPLPRTHPVSGPVHPRGARRRPGSSFHPRPRANRVLPLPLSDILLLLPFVPPFPSPPRPLPLPPVAFFLPTRLQRSCRR